MAHVVGSGLCDVLAGASAEALHNGCYVFAGSRHVDHPHQTCKHALLKDVLLSGHLYRRISLCKHGKQLLFVALYGVDELKALLAPDDYWGQHAGKHHKVARYEHGQLVVCVLVEDGGDVAVKVGNHLY